MKIKNILKLSLVSGLFLMSACTDLEFDNQGGIIPDGVGDSEELLASAYGVAREFANERTLFGLSEHPSDVLIGPTRGGDWFDGGVFQQMHLHEWHPDHTFIITSWQTLNEGVFKATQAIEGTGANPQIIAAAKTIRAYYLFHILDFWGITAFRGATEGLEVDPLVRNSAESVAWIIEDLESALSDLPERSNPNVANKNTARAILCKLYLNKAVYETSDRSVGTFNFNASDMAKVVEYADAITATGIYNLSPGVEGYFNTFAEKNDDQSTEIILSVPPSQIPVFKAKWNCTLHWNQKPPGWSGYATLSDFYDTFEEGDSRLGGAYNSITNPYTSSTGVNAGFLIGQQFDEKGNEIFARDGVTPVNFTREVDLKVNGEVEGIRVLKYIPDFTEGVDNADNPGNSMVLLRYGDVLVNKAEALFRAGDVAGAEAVINDLRTIRFGKDAPLTLTLETLLEERGRELYWEGWRRNDLVRFGKFLDEWQEKPTTSSEKVLFPIPTTAILANPNLNQNPGY
ncbi:MAG: RagB/SusD family nutrient uptake outer membrane protein [Bacteroidota bacterium]